jgi:hypothetical protein
MLKQCNKHGQTEHAEQGRGKNKRFRCKKCSVEAVSKRRKNLKEQAVKYKGGKCEKCGYFKCISALEFHHTDSTKKDFGIAANGNTRSWEKMKVELDKCIMLCSNCHREVHEDMRL